MNVGELWIQYQIGQKEYHWQIEPFVCDALFFTRSCYQHSTLSEPTRKRRVIKLNQEKIYLI